MIFISQWFLVSIFPTKDGEAERSFASNGVSPMCQVRAHISELLIKAKVDFQESLGPLGIQPQRCGKLVLRWKHGTYGTRTGKQWCRYGKPTGSQGTWSTNGV
jgi:hypothetical protein